ncbi:MAG: hypothetical protein JWM97_3320 [Phycisphaerales bacterium]|nr:hypothetical protein [Phycisphaerales bacterium]MDB5305771.1 hypothetical protein [Phycisphaerales bacterium]
MSSKLLSVLLALITCAAVPAFGQAPPPGGGGQGGPGGGPGGPGGGPGGRPDFAQMRKMFEERMKQQLEVNDDQWAAIQPKIEKIQQLQRDASGRGFGRGPGGPGGPGGPDQQLSPVQEKVKALQEAVASPDATPEDVKAKLEALRHAKAEARKELAKAQDDLRTALNLKQEAVLVVMGMLD